MKNTRSRKSNTIEGRELNVSADLPDLRDRMYRPTLLDLKPTLRPPVSSVSPILDQGTEGACTGFALAAAINLQNNSRRAQMSPRLAEQLPDQVSPRMLYEMAKLHDEWPGHNYQGSSIRGALKGFFHNGACNKTLAPYRSDQTKWHLTIKQAKNARIVGLGAYYRLQNVINDYHAALNETGVILASAKVHSGWKNPKNGIIKQPRTHGGGHAFVIVGYNENGFIIQNSWGKDWGGYNGAVGLALWSYADWAENIMDAWVTRLSVPTPDFFDLTNVIVGKTQSSSVESINLFPPKRSEINGHFIHLNDGNLIETGRYATPLKGLVETAKLLESDGNLKKPEYKHLMFYAHGGLNSSVASANRIKTWKEVFKRNGIYPIHFMWESGLLETLADVVIGYYKKKTEERVGGFTDWFDNQLEDFLRIPGRALWRDMKHDASLSFQPNSGGTKALNVFLEANNNRKSPMQIHLFGHSAGSIMFAELLRSSASSLQAMKFKSVSLLAPGCTIDLYNKTYAQEISNSDRIEMLKIYNLIDSRELDDSVYAYKKSLLYLVSRAFEEGTDKGKAKPLLGMEKYTGNLNLTKPHDIYFAGRDDAITNSSAHGKFDNDKPTMNHVLSTILGKKPSRKNAFQDNDLRGY